MAQNDIDDALDQLRRIKSGGHLSNFKIDQIKTLEMQIRLFRTFTKYNHILLPDFLVKITKKAKLIVEMLHLVFGGIPDECQTNLKMERLESQLLEFIEGNTILSYNYELKDSCISEYMDWLGKNLNDVWMFLERNKSDYSLSNEEIHEMNRFIKQLKMVQKKMRFLRFLYVSEVNGYVYHEKLEGLETRIQFMADNVGQYCLALSDKIDDTGINEDEDIRNVVDTNIDEDEDKRDLVETNVDEEEDDILSKPSYLLCLIVLVELEMKKIFLGQLKGSKFTQPGTFKDKKLPKGFSHNLHNLLLYLRKKKLENFPNNISSKNIDVAIDFLLVFLNADLSNHVTNGKKLNEVLVKVGVIAGDVLYVIQNLLPSSINENDTSKVSLCSVQILEKTKDLKAQIETYYKSLKFSTPSQFTTVGGLSFLDSLTRKLNEMLKSKSGLVFMMKPNIGFSVKELSSLMSILEKELSSLTFVFREIVKVQHKHEDTFKDLQRRTVNLAYEAEASIDSILVQYNALWHCFCSLPSIIKEIKHIRAEVTEMWSADVALKPCYEITPSKQPPTQHRNPVNDEEIVGFENETDTIIQYLIGDRNELDVVPIVGMGGQGKTTIAREVYNNDWIVSHFDVRAWCIVSQTYNRRMLIQEIFNQVTGSEDEGDEVDKLADKLRKSLMKKRCLIVLDDMWDGIAWDDLMLCFTDVGDRSRIIITTRLEKVGKQVKLHTDPYFLPFLTPDDCFKLLEKKVFEKEDCPPELQYVILAVAEKCKGLPLVIILVAGIIKRNKMEASWWHEVKDSLLSYLGESEGYSLSTMQLSYNNLPDYLKPCMLYMGMFPEDARIPVSKLISLWIAEGFVQNIESGTLMEDAAESYLMDLIHSNVVMVSKREYDHKVKYCQVHDVVLHFCLEKSREEKFMLAVKGQFQPSDWKENRVKFIFSEELPKFASLGCKTRNHFHPHLRSLIITDEREFFDWIPFHQVSEVRLLKVLDLSSHDVVHLSSATLKPLIHLKYLAVNIFEFHFHPESHLPPHLETLIVKGSTALPEVFWKMEKLRHVDITKAKFYYENNMQQIFEESSKLENLKILREVEFPSHEVDKVDVLSRRCPNLQELGIFFGYNNGSLVIHLKLEGLTQLQSLRLSFDWPLFLSGLHLPSNLKKLRLKATYRESVISFIAGLPNLECLQLCDPLDLDYDQLWNSFISTNSRVWCLGDIKFLKLKFLKLADLRISRWDVSEESFPLLETLVIKGCDKLKEIPPSFANIPKLEQIKLIRCKNISLEASAVKIKEEVRDIEGCDRIDITIG